MDRTEHLNRKAIEEMVKRKGIFQILSSLEENSKSFSDINEETTISSSTLSKHLKFGVKDGLWEQKLETLDDGGSKKVYSITEYGEKNLIAAEKIDLIDALEQKRAAENAYNDKIEEFIEKVPDAIDIESHREMTEALDDL